MTMRLKHLDLRFTMIGDAHAAALARLTSVTKFDPNRLDIHNPSFFSQMTRLKELELSCTPQVDPALLVSSLSHCSRIEELTLEGGRMTNAHLCTLLPSLPHLEKLTLTLMIALTSLSFASSVPHLSHTLHEFTLDQCRSLPLTQLRHLRALTALTELDIFDSFIRPLDDYTTACMSRSSKCFMRQWWPHLTGLMVEDQRNEERAEDERDDDDRDIDDGD